MAWLAAGAVAAAMAASAATTAPAAGKPDTAERVLAAINRERHKHELPPIRLNAKLTKAAQEYAGYMARRNVFSHTADGRSCGDRIKAAGYAFSKAGEIILKGASTPAGAVKGWMNSPGHRKAILGDFTEMGAGRFGEYWVVDFAVPR